MTEPTVYISACELGDGTRQCFAGPCPKFSDLLPCSPPEDVQNAEECYIFEVTGDQWTKIAWWDEFCELAWGLL